MKSLILSAVLSLFAAPLAANPYAENVSVRLLPGWQLPDGAHMAAIEVTLADGWKTYWRAPGDAGVPPVFSWAGSDNVRAVQVVWPRPEVFWQNGMRSIGYSKHLVLPLRIEPGAQGPVHLDGSLQMGICSDICVPLVVDLQDLRLPDSTRPVPAIAAAMADRPYSGAEAGVRRVSCSVQPDGRKVRLRTEIEMPALGGTEVVVVETADPSVWVSETETRREGPRLIAETELQAMRGGVLMLDRSGLRLTVLGGSRAVDIRGCPAG